jgi:hypothetical protein
VLQVQATRQQRSGGPACRCRAGLDAVTLPDQWQHRWPGHDGAVWYRLDWELDCIDPAQPIALSLYSMVLAGEVYLNQDLLWRDQHLQEPLSRSWNLPRYTLLPASALRPAEPPLDPCARPGGPDPGLGKCAWATLPPSAPGMRHSSGVSAP